MELNLWGKKTWKNWKKIMKKQKRILSHEKLEKSWKNERESSSESKWIGEWKGGINLWAALNFLSLLLTGNDLQSTMIPDLQSLRPSSVLLLPRCWVTFCWTKSRNRTTTYLLYRPRRWRKFSLFGPCLRRQLETVCLQQIFVFKHGARVVNFKLLNIFC